MPVADGWPGKGMRDSAFHPRKHFLFMIVLNDPTSTIAKKNCVSTMTEQTAFNLTPRFPTHPTQPC